MRGALSLVAAAAVAWPAFLSPGVVSPGAISLSLPPPQLAPQSAREIALSAPKSAPEEPSSTLRVGMWTLWHDHDVTLSPAQHEKFTLLQTCDHCPVQVLHAAAKIHAEKDGVTLTTAAQTIQSSQIRLSGPVVLSAHGETVSLHDPVAITAHAGELVIVVTLPVEDYVERVVSSESALDDSAESLKALAIVVRTFALHEKHGHADYDLCDSTHCQLLRWTGTEGAHRTLAHAATQATAGETLWFRGARALAYFGKDCGGRTASPEEIWPHAKAVPYLPSRPDPFCDRREWASEISVADLTAALARHSLAAPGWQTLTVARRGESGRAVTLRLTGTEMAATEISAEDFRLAVGESLGWNRVPSTWFGVSREGDRFVFHGRGWGHGVGLCQKGAAVMAKQGHTASEILAQYFPGAGAADEATGREWATIRGDGFVLQSLDAGDAAYMPDLNRARAEASQRSGLNAAQPFTVRAFPSTPAFRDATLAPGWVAAFTEGGWIGTQPLHTLAARHLLADTIRHEFQHALVEHEASANTPLWLREGLVEVWSEENGASQPGTARTPKPRLTPDAVNVALAHASSEAESASAHRAAAWYAAQLLARYGRAQVLEWLRSGLPAGIAAGAG